MAQALALQIRLTVQKNGYSGSFILQPHGLPPKSQREANRRRGVGLEDRSGLRSPQTILKSPQQKKLAKPMGVPSTSSVPLIEIGERVDTGPEPPCLSSHVIGGIQISHGNEIPEEEGVSLLPFKEGQHEGIQEIPE